MAAMFSAPRSAMVASSASMSWTGTRRVSGTKRFGAVALAVEVEAGDAGPVGVQAVVGVLAAEDGGLVGAGPSRCQCRRASLHATSMASDPPELRITLASAMGDRPASRVARASAWSFTNRRRCGRSPASASGRAPPRRVRGCRGRCWRAIARRCRRTSGVRPRCGCRALAALDDELPPEDGRDVGLRGPQRGPVEDGGSST